MTLSRVSSLLLYKDLTRSQQPRYLAAGCVSTPSAQAAAQEPAGHSPAGAQGEDVAIPASAPSSLITGLLLEKHIPCSSGRCWDSLILLMTAKLLEKHKQTAATRCRVTFVQGKCFLVQRHQRALKYHPELDVEQEDSHVMVTWHVAVGTYRGQTPPSTALAKAT